LGKLAGRVAKLEAATAGPERMYVLSVGEHDDEDAAVARLLPDACPADLVVIVRRYGDPDTPASLCGCFPMAVR
jgi:hypothetical protein